ASDVIEPVIASNGHYLVVLVLHGASRSELYAKRLGGTSPFQPVVTGIQAKFVPTLAGDEMFVTTDCNAPKGRVLRIDLRYPERQNWKEVVPEREGVLEQALAAGGMLVLRSTVDASSRLRLVTYEGKPVRQIPLPCLWSVGKASYWTVRILP